MDTREFHFSEGITTTIPMSSAVTPDSRIDFLPHEWFWANWRNLEPLKRREPRPFDRSAADKLRKKITSRVVPLWGDAGLDGGLSDEEAAYWFAAIRNVDEGAKVDGGADAFGERNTKAPPELIRCLVQMVGPVRVVELILEQQNHLDATLKNYKDRNWWRLVTGIVEGVRKYVRPYMTASELSSAQSIVRSALANGYWPPDYFDTPKAAIFLAAIVGVPDILEPMVASIPDTAYAGDLWSAHYQFTHQAVLGLGSASVVVREMNRLKLKLQFPEYIAGWLAHTEVEQLEFIARTIRNTTTKDDAETLLSAFSRVVSPVAAPHMLDLSRESKAPKVAKQWLTDHPVEAIHGLIATAAGRGSLPEAAIDYLRGQKKAGHLVTIEAAVAGQPAPVADRVREFVVDYVEREYVAFDDASTPSWLADALAAVSPNQKRMACAADLPPIVIGDRKLTDVQIGLVLDALSTATLDGPIEAGKKPTTARSSPPLPKREGEESPEPTPARSSPPLPKREGEESPEPTPARSSPPLPKREGEEFSPAASVVIPGDSSEPLLNPPLRKARESLFAELKANGDASSVDRFGWALFEWWLSEGAPPKERWPLVAVGLLGGDASALKLAALVKKWPGESQHQRAVLGLECLRAIGTDTALMQINGIANKVPFRAIKERAAECMDDIAKARGMTRAELEDRIVPDCDLDENGSRTFDFGARQFRFVLSPEMKAMVKDEAGKIVPDLPKPNAKDDPEKAALAVAEWKLLKKQITEVAKVQAVRLEQAMVTGRRWSATEFEQLLLRHPLMTNLVRTLVWGGYGTHPGSFLATPPDAGREGVSGDGGQLSSTFRVTEDQTLAGMDDQTFVLPANGRVGIVHPLQLSAEERSAWGEILSDYEIIPPFMQLGRVVYELPEDERDVVELKRFGQQRLPCATVVFTLEKLEWVRAQPGDNGWFREHVKPFPGANVTAVAQYEPGCGVGNIVEGDRQQIVSVFFVPGIVPPEEWRPTNEKRLKWGDVDPVVVSEVISDLTTIVAKAG